MILAATHRSVPAVPRNRSSLRRAVPVLAALVAFLLPAPPVRADQTADWHAMLYSGPGLCVHGESQLVRRDTAVAGLWDAGLYPTAILGTFATCTGALSTYTYRMMPVGWAAMDMQLLIWNGSAWAVCRDYGWTYNTFPVASTDLQASGLGLHPCGSGYYEVFAGFYAWDGSAWQGGWIWSGYLYSQ